MTEHSDMSRDIDVKFVIFSQEIIEGFCKKYFSSHFVGAPD